MTRDLPGLHTTLDHYPWVVVRFRCTRCRRNTDEGFGRGSRPMVARAIVEDFGGGYGIGLPKRGICFKS